MAQVYLAKTMGDGSEVAVKIMNTEHVRKAKSLERFRREAKLLCRLNHPNLVHGISTGQYDGRPLIVMEYVNGPDICELISKRGRLNPGESLKLLLDVALALDHLFAEGSLQAHRDIKPQNILVAPGGSAKLTDFGIAKAYDDADAMTMTSSFLGSPHYMSPEQITDPRMADVRSDIYALGAVFYEMLTGEKAFPGQGTKEILDAHFELEAPTLAGKGDLVDSCNVVLAKTMAFESSERYQNPRELVDHLIPLVDKDITVSVPRFARSSIRFAAAIAAAGVIAAIIIGLTLANGHNVEAAGSGRAGRTGTTNSTQAPEIGTPQPLGTQTPAESAKDSKASEVGAKATKK